MNFNLLNWLMGPIGKWVLVALLFTGWTVGNRVDAARKARAECQLDQVQAQLEAEKARAAKAEKIAEAARLQADKTQIELTELEKVKNDLLEQLDSQGPACDIPDDLRQRLLGIR